MTKSSCPGIFRNTKSANMNTISVTVGHTVELEKIMADYDDIFPVCIGGEGNCPSEDVGGEGGYDEFLEAIRNPRHPEHQEMIDRGEGQQYLQFDLSKINTKLYHSFTGIFTTVCKRKP